MNLITEIVKSFLPSTAVSSKGNSAPVSAANTLIDLTDHSDSNVTAAFFDDESTNTLFGVQGVQELAFKQRDKIIKYRSLALSTDVTDAVDEIVNETAFVYDDAAPLKIEVNEENENVAKAVTQCFNKISKLMNVNRNLHNIVKSGYVDGQVVFCTAYDKKNTKNGIKSIKLIDPCLLYLDPTDELYKYADEHHTSDLFRQRSIAQNTRKFSIEEIVREDFGIRNDGLILGYLEYAIKPANLLRTLEDLLVPLRFSRSISRRVFNVDIGDLPVKRGAEVMRNYQTKFKYKKFYNNTTGEVTNQQHITSMVEDYWFANRSGGKGTTVDVLDETGNLGELNDILYFSRKLYRAMKIPASRINIDPDSDHSFDYSSTSTSKEDMKFFMFISRIRQVFSSAFKEILKREVVSTGVMTSDEWTEKESSISISFVNENKFIERMRLENFSAAVDSYSNVQDLSGKLFSHRYTMKEVFRFSDDEIESMLKDLKKEKDDKLFSAFYESDPNF